jgi:tetratricopeptide (TPR) repeat protein
MFFTLDMKPTFMQAGWALLAPFVLLALVRESVRLLRPGPRGARVTDRGPKAVAAAPRPGSLRLEAGWAIALPLAYFVLLPYGHRFGRYLAPALPAFAILGFAGLRDVVAVVARRTGGARWMAPLAAAALVIAMLAVQIRGAIAAANGYAAICRYHYVRHERTGRWLAENTPPEAVVATHDVGAIAFYSRRRIVDVVGLIDPEVTPHLRSPDYMKYLEDLFGRTHVTHIAALRNWLGVDAVAPLFTADPRPEVMEVYPWIPGRTHLIARRAHELTVLAERALQEGDAQRALSFLQAAARVDDRSARIWSLAGHAWEKIQHPAEAEASYRRALTLFPESEEARYGLAVVLSEQGKRDAARAELQTLLARSPNHPAARELSQRLGE